MLAVGIVCQDGAARGGGSRSTCPFVRADCIIGPISLSKERFWMKRSAPLAGWREGDSPRTEFVGLQNVVRNATGVQPCRNLETPLRLQLATQPIGNDSSGANNAVSLPLRNRVGGECMAADTDDIFG